MIEILQELRQSITEEHLRIVDDVWENKHSYLRWPKSALLLKPETVRIRYHKYSEEEKSFLKSKSVTPDSRSNGPAICAFLASGGERPTRSDGNGWTIHHIYDGRFPFPGRSTTVHAVKEPNLFSEASGLVAAHPIADALADEFAYFVWLLRYDAYELFDLDPDEVFSTPPNK